MRDVLAWAITIGVGLGLTLVVDAHWAPIVWGCVVALLAMLVVGHYPPVSRRSLAFGRRRPLLSTVLAGAIGAVIFATSWYIFIHQKPQPTALATPQAAAVEQPLYRFAMRSMVVSNVPGDLSLFMVGYTSMFGHTLSPVYCLANVEITNGRSIQVTVDRLGIAAADNSDGPWIDLVQIPIRGRSLYMLGASNNRTAPRRVELPSSTYLASTRMTTKDLTRAALVEAVPTLEEELSRPIAANATISGWAAFDVPMDAERHAPNYVKIAVHDTSGVAVSGVIESPRPQPRDTHQDMQPGILNALGSVANVRKFHIRRYADKYPERIKPKKR